VGNWRTSPYVRETYSLLATDVNGALVGSDHVITEADTTWIKGLMVLPGDGNGGLQPLVAWNAETKQFVVQYKVRKYEGEPFKYLSYRFRMEKDTATGMLVKVDQVKKYAAANGLPDTLTVAQYNMAKALDASKDKKIDGEAVGDYREVDGYTFDPNNPVQVVTPAEQAENLRIMLDQANTRLFAAVVPVTFSLGFMVGGPHAAFTAMAQLFRI
jgi:hypothetical protein